MTATSDAFKGIVSPLLHPSLPADQIDRRERNASWRITNGWLVEFR